MLFRKKKRSVKNMGKYGWHANKLTAYDVTIDNDLSLAGDLTFGDAVVDSFVIKGRVSTSTVAGAALSLTASYAYGELMELRCDVASWTGTGNSFKGMYLRSSCSVGNASGGLRGAEIMGVFNVTTGTTGLSELKGLYVETLVKANSSGNKTIATLQSVEANVSIENYGATTLTFTNNVYGLYAKIQTGSGLADYTKMCGIRISGRDDGTARVFGTALDITDAEATVCTWTKGIYIKNTAIKADGTGYAIQIQGGSATIKGIFVGADADAAGSGIKLAGASWDTSQGNGFYCDDGGTALTGYTETMTVRMLTTAAVASGDVSTAALHPDLTLNANYTGTGGLSSIWGNTTIKSGKTINLNGSLGDVGGATFGLDLSGTLAANSHGCGCSVGIGGSGTKSGIICGYRIRAATGTVDWDGILSIEDGDGSWTGMTKTAASNTATMTNSPKTGDPAYWLKIYIAETAYYFPVWTD